MTTSQTEFETTEAEAEIVYCHRRNCPGSTGLRCYQTGVPICMKCAVQTPVGYISKDAAKAQADKYFNIQATDYIVAGMIAFMATLIIGFFATQFLGFWLFMIFIGPLAGGVIGDLVFRAIRRRRGRYTRQVVIGAMVTACLFVLLLSFNLLAVGIFGFTAVSAAMARLQVAL